LAYQNSPSHQNSQTPFPSSLPSSKQFFPLPHLRVATPKKIQISAYPALLYPSPKFHLYQEIAFPLGQYSSQHHYLQVAT